jgi:2-hydroxychromene-2-carboxylate isomerase
LPGKRREMRGSTPMPEIEFWYDFASPYGYIAAMRIDDLASAAGIAVTWRPLLLGPIFAARPGNPGPFQNAPPAEAAYRRRDVTRLCRRYELPLRWPSIYPRTSLLAARVALLGTNEGWTPGFSRAVYVANFAEDRDIAAAETVSGILDSLGLPARVLIDEAGTPDSKARLKDQVERAVSLGIFGAPSFRTGDGELFWGQDRLDQALEWASDPAVRVAQS